MRPTHDTLLGVAWAGRGAPGICPVVVGAHLQGGCGTLQGASHLALAADRVAHGAHRSDDGAIPRYNLHSVHVGENLCRPHRWAGSPTRS